MLWVSINSQHMFLLPECCFQAVNSVSSTSRKEDMYPHCSSSIIASCHSCWPPRYLTDETWHLLAGSSSGELSGSGEAQVEALWWGHRLQMALVNTVAFRGVWQKQFQFTNTQNLPFILSDGSAIKVPMMYQATEVSFGKRCHYEKVVI